MNMLDGSFCSVLFQSLLHDNPHGLVCRLFEYTLLPVPIMFAAQIQLGDYTWNEHSRWRGWMLADTYIGYASLGGPLLITSARLINLGRAATDSRTTRDSITTSFCVERSTSTNVNCSPLLVSSAMYAPHIKQNLCTS
jgi:hypothetical protein